MSSLEAAVAEAAAVRGALGAVLCDFEGEAVVTQVGTTPLSADVAEEALKHVPRGVASHHAPEEFLLRLGGAEPCALLALFGRSTRSAGGGELEGFELRFKRVGVIVERLPEDYYLTIVVVLSTAGGLAEARRVAQRVRPVLVAEIA